MTRLRAVLAVLLAASFTPAMAATRSTVFAGGNFNDFKPEFAGRKGIVSVETGYVDGDIQAIRVTFDDAVISYDGLLTIFWRNIDPFDGSGQFCNRGHAYNSGIFPETDEDRAAAETTLRAHERRFGQVLPVTIATPRSFRLAAGWEQDFAHKYPSKYRFQRILCRRDERLREVWGGAAPQ